MNRKAAFLLVLLGSRQLQVLLFAWQLGCGVLCSLVYSKMCFLRCSVHTWEYSSICVSLTLWN